MKKYVKWIIALVIIGIIGGVGAWWYTFHKPALNVFDEKATLSVEAKKIVEDFSNDEVKAYAIYTNKANNMVISINGPIVNIEKSDTNSTVVVEADIMGIRFEFKGDYFKNQIEKINKLQIGQIVKIKGKCNGYNMDVFMDNCVIEE